MKKILLRLFLAFPILLTVTVRAQFTPSCYKPLNDSDVVASVVQGGLLCPACTFVQDAPLITDGNTNNFAVYNTTLGLANGSGISVRDTVKSYPAGYYAGYVIDFGAGVLSTGILTGFQLQTYLNGVLQEGRNTTNGLSVTLLSGTAGRIYLSFETALAFNEVRLTFNNAVGTIDNMRIYYAMAFPGNCGFTDNNGICYDQIGAPSAVVNYNGGLLSALVGLTSPGALIDGDRNTAATLTLPAGVSLLSTPPYVGVKDLEVIYPAGTRAGFMIGYPATLLTTDVLNTFILQTYLHGELQESVQNISGSPSLLKLSALSVAGTDRKELSFVTTLPYNEIRLVVAQPATVNVGSINIYSAFESGPGCTDCQQPLISTAPSPYTGSVNAAGTGVTGTLCLSSINGTPNLVDATLTNAATFNTTLGVNCNATFAVQNNGPDFPANTFAGFAVRRLGALLDVGLLSAMTISVYRDGNPTAVASSTGAGLLSTGLLTGTDSVGYFGFRPTVPFDEIRININAGLLAVGLGGTYEVRYAYVIRDDDNDGMSDCNEVCGTSSSDAVDSDNDGISDPCDACNTIGFKSSYQDTDQDGFTNACDADADNDGIADFIEDTNGDGNPLNDDADGDGLPNYQDLDSDNDGLSDLSESGLTPAQLATIDANNDGVVDTGAPLGANGMVNIAESADNNTATINYTLRDSNLDGLPNYLDPNNVTLPLTLVSFTATKQEQSVLLKWKTVMEEDFKHFEVERSANARDFTVIGIVRGSGYAGGSSYSHTDLQPGETVVYYRLRMVDIDGSFSYSATVAVRPDPGTRLELRPNPARSVLQVSLPPAAGTDITIRVMNSHGQSLITRVYKNEGGTMVIPLDISKLQSGTYFIQVIRGGQQESRSFIKQ